MTDILGLDPTSFLIYLIVLLACAVVGAWYYVSFSKPKSTFLIERLKPGYNILRNVKEERTKNPGDIIIHLKDGRRYAVPAGSEGNCEIVHVPQSVKIKKGWRKLWLLENDQLVRMADSFVQASTALISPSMIPIVTGRKSLGRLGNKGLAGGGYTMLILAGVAAFAVGYIMYPQFNHAVPVVEYCTKTANGTLSCGLTPP